MPIGEVRSFVFVQIFLLRNGDQIRVVKAEIVMLLLELLLYEEKNVGNKTVAATSKHCAV